MFVLFYFCVTSISWLTFGSQATETDCNRNCVDYNRFCRAVKNPTYYEEYSAKHSAGQLGVFSNIPLPPPPDCDTGFYQYLCPRSCEICKSCERIPSEKAGLRNGVTTGAETPDTGGTPEPLFLHESDKFVTNETPDTGGAPEPLFLHESDEVVTNETPDTGGTPEPLFLHESDEFVTNETPDTGGTPEPLFLHESDEVVTNETPDTGGTPETLFLHESDEFVTNETSDTGGTPEPLYLHESDEFLTNDEQTSDAGGTLEPLFLHENDELVTNAPSLYVTGGTAPTHQEGHDLEYGYTKEGHTLTPDTCYQSQNKSNQEAILQIPSADVTKVELLNRNHEKAAMTEGQVVSICFNGTKGCKQCPASYSEAGNGAWLPYDCPEGTKGNTIIVYHSSYYTIFCEVKVVGTTPSLYVTGGTAATHQEGYDLEHGYTKEGQTLTPDKCYRSKNMSNQEAILQIPLADITKVELLNGNKKPAKTEGQVVYVCTDGKQNCKQCPASYSEAGKWAWLPYDCPQDTKGNEILVYHSSYHTTFCEIWITGYKLI